MPAALAAAVSAVILGATGLALAALFRPRSLAELVLAAYLVGFAEVVALVLVLSPFGAVRRPVLLLGMVGICAVAVGAWVRAGRPRPAVRLPRRLADALPVAALAGVVVAAFAYVLVLGLGTPPNTVDSLVYHLARAALWRQQGSAGYIDAAYDERLNANPPNAELAVGFVLELTRDERFASLVQLASALACAVAVFALARRIGLLRGEALFGALLFLTLPIVLLQSSTTLNDLVVVAPLLSATVFVLGSERRLLLLVALATALAIGTKLTAILALPIVVVVALVAVPKDSRTTRLAAVATGALVGSYWYWVNLLETGKVLGDRQDTGLIAIGDFRENLLAGYARILDAFELPGAEGASKWVLPGLAHSDAFVYVIAAAVLLVLLLVPRGERRSRRGAALAAAGLALLPLAVPPASYGLWRVFAKLHDLFGGTAALLPVGEWPPQTVASDTFSWFGPVGLFLILGSCVVGVVGYRRSVLEGVGLVLATAPLLWWVLFSLTIGYDPLQGRFFVFPVALSASVWGTALRVRPIAWAVVAVAACTTLLTLVNSLEKPSGLHLFAQRSTAPVWRMPRWEVQATLRAEDAPLLRYLEEQVPRHASVGLMLGVDGLGYPAFGRHLERDVELVGGGDRARPADVGWLVADPSRAAEVDRACWRAMLLTPDGSAVFRARTHGACSS